MDKFEEQQEKARQEALDESLKRASAFEAMMGTDGWKLVEAFYQNEIKAFTNSALSEGKNLENLDDERNQLIGIRKLFGYIQGDLDVLKRHREKKTG